ncbi:MAG: hypothetical protein WB297_17245 [Actinomycetota bacterium]
MRAGDEEQNIVFGAGGLWLADGIANSVFRIDPVTRELTVFPMAGPVADVAVDPDRGWCVGSGRRRETMTDPVEPSLPGRGGPRNGDNRGVVSRRKRSKRDADPLAAYRRIRKPMPPPEKVVPDRRRELEGEEARREIEEER